MSAPSARPLRAIAFLRNPAEELIRRMQTRNFRTPFMSVM
jgi:hypothetical protein